LVGYGAEDDSEVGIELLITRKKENYCLLERKHKESSIVERVSRNGTGYCCQFSESLGPGYLLCVI
jgi:hypothetical protein